MAKPSRTLLLIGCSGMKVESEVPLPAVSLYDGPMYRTLRARLRSFSWSENLSIGILSAKYGLMGALTHIENYDFRMTSARAAELRDGVNQTLVEFAKGHTNVQIILGQDYRHAIDLNSFRKNQSVDFAEGPIGMKLHRLSSVLDTRLKEAKVKRTLTYGSRAIYFLPDWDDFLDANFDFIKDKFSAEARADRTEVHPVKIFQPERLCDGILVSLAQNLGGKGLLRHVQANDPYSLRPRSVRRHFGLANDQWAFGDCGAFSYVNEPRPTISVQQAVALYNLYDFDLGASVDHIPVEEIFIDSKKRKLTKDQRYRRVKITKANADAFLIEAKRAGSSFTPVGVIQGLTAKSFGTQLHEYLEMGYEHIALGGLVPRSDDEIKEIVIEVNDALKNVREKPWIHLLGVFRPKLQNVFKSVGINSFDSATYFRKAWLRTDQNYLGADGKWYAAIRIPPSSDPRTLIRLKDAGRSERSVKALEREAMRALRNYDSGLISVDKCLQSILKYDRLLSRGEFSNKDLEAQYRTTLENKPWNKCKCAICSSIGIDALVFRGYNRNKRRGAHNTLMLFGSLTRKK